MDFVTILVDEYGYFVGCAFYQINIVTYVRGDFQDQHHQRKGGEKR